MKSRWFDLKEKAISLRKKGRSIRIIEQQLGIPRSTLSGWLRGVKLSARHKRRLLRDWHLALIKARRKAVLWHNGQKQLRIRRAEAKADELLSNIQLYDSSTLELAFSMLYLGEGFKSNATAMGNSDPLLLRFFIAVLVGHFNVDPKKIRGELHLRYDQNPLEIKRFWSRELQLPISNFGTVSVDPRTKGTQTYSHYKGVCVLRCGKVAIQRELLYLGKVYCQKIIEKYNARVAQLVRASV